MTCAKSANLITSTAAFALAILFACALAGCGDQQATSSSAEVAADQATEVAIPDDVAAISDVTRSIAENADTEGADKVDSLPKADGVDGKTLEASEIEVGADDDSKYSGDLVLVQQGGIQMTVPATWRGSGVGDSFVAANPDGTVLCVVSAYRKSAGETIPLEDLAKAVPVQLADKGLANLKVINYGTDYSATGALCTSYVFCSGESNGRELMVYDQFVDSKTYVNLVEVVATSSDFKANFDEINTLIGSLYFKSGEEI